MKKIKEFLKKIKWRKAIKYIIFFLIGVILLIYSVVPARNKKGSYVANAAEITNLTGTTWVFNDSVSVRPGQWGTYYINFSYNNIEYVSIHISGSQVFFLPASASSYDIIYDDGWLLDVRQINITGGSDVEDEHLIYVLNTNATLIEDTHEFVILSGSYYITLNNPFNYAWDFTGEQRFDIKFSSSNYEGFIENYEGMYVGIQSNFSYLSYFRNSDGTGEVIAYTTEMGRGWGLQTMRRVTVLSDYIIPNTDVGTAFYLFWEQHTIQIETPTETETEWYNMGYNDGYEAGLNIGRQEANIGTGIWDGVWSFIGMFFSAVTNMLSTEIAPGLTVGLLVVGIPMSLYVIEFIIYIIKNVFSSGAGG